MSKVLLLFLWLAAGPVLPSVRRNFFYHSKPKTWEDARQFCRSEHQGDLATVVRSSDTQDLNLQEFQAWFGLKRVDTAWQWVDVNYSLSRKKRSSSSSSSSSLSAEEPTNVYDIMKVFMDGEPQTGECGKVIYGYPNHAKRPKMLLAFGLSQYIPMAPNGVKLEATKLFHGHAQRPDRAFGEVCDQKLFVFCKDLLYVYLLPETKTWAEGLQYCKSQIWGYMGFPGIDPILFDATAIYDFPVWLGLHGDGGAWNWSDGSDSHYRDWGAGSDPEPSPGPGSCVAISSQTHSMSVKDCSEAYPFLCYRHNLVLVPELLTWEEALETCWTLNSSDSFRSYSLLSLEESELVFALSQTREASTSKVWVGLRFLNSYWFWSDGSPVTLPSLLPCPESTFHCGAMDRNSSSIQPNDCSQRLNALCYKEP